MSKREINKPYGSDAVLPDCIPTKRCPRCGEVKATTAFYGNRRYKSGLACYCKACDAALHAEKTAKNHDAKIAASIERKAIREAKKEAAIEPTGILKVCPKCYIEKDTSKFHTRIHATGNITHPFCLQCYRESEYARHHGKTYDKSFKVRRVIEVSHPDKYNIDQVINEYHIFCACTNLTDAQIVAQQLKDIGSPYIIGVWWGNPDDGSEHDVFMRCITVFAEPVTLADYENAFFRHYNDDESCIWDIWGRDIIL